MGKILELNNLAQEFKERIKAQAAKLGKITLASLKVGDDASSQSYISSQERIAKELGVNYLLKSFDDSVTESEFISEILKFNKDENVTGIIVNKPFPRRFNEVKIFSSIDLGKDIEGMNPCDLGLLMMGKYAYISPTVLSVLEFLKSQEVSDLIGATLKGKDITLIGSSLLIGKPLAMILADMFSTVTLTNIGTYEAGRLQAHLKDADVVISAVGKPSLVKGDWLKENAIVIDVGCSQQGDKVLGDVEFDQAVKKAALVTPVPGGVGKLTTLFLFDNLIKAAQYKNL